MGDGVDAQYGIVEEEDRDSAHIEGNRVSDIHENTSAKKAKLASNAYMIV